jgi:hypothetical protein
MVDHSQDDDNVVRAAREGLAHGLRDHLPGAVGIAIKGSTACAICAVAHLVLGISVPGSLISAMFTGAGIGGLVWVRS